MFLRPAEIILLAIFSLDVPSIFNDSLNGQSTTAIKIKIRSLIESESLKAPYDRPRDCGRTDPLWI